MHTRSVMDSSVWMSQQVNSCQQTSQVSSNTQGTGAAGGQDGQELRARHHHHGGMGRALMETLNQMGLTKPSHPNNQRATETASDGAQGGSWSHASGAQSIQRDMRNFMHALFQTLRSQEQSSSSNANSSPAGIGGSRFENGLSSLISQLASNSGSDNSQNSSLTNAFNTLVQDLQNRQSNGTGPQPSQSVTLQSFLTALQQNLQSAPKPIWAVGNVLDTRG